MNRWMKPSAVTEGPLPERSRRLRKLVAETRRVPNGEVADLERRIREFEQRHGVDSATMLAEVEAGTREETWEVCQWMMLLDMRDRLAAIASCS